MKISDSTDKISSYFAREWKNLFLVTVSGIIYNIGLLAGPFFEGKLAQCLMDILGGSKVLADMVLLVGIYLATIALVQCARYIKRFFVRRFANNINREMKHVIYGNLVHLTKHQIDNENAGTLMTKAISDVNSCAEGMRKFTTEIFDTGVALLGYIVMLLCYDWKLALISLIFPPFSYIIAEKMKTIVQKTSAKFKESSGNLSDATLDRVGNALTYRIHGQESERNLDYDKYLKDYEKKAVLSNVLVQSLPPIYQVISLISVVFIIFFGGRNVISGSWNVAAFTTFLSCFAKMAVKSSKAAKLFNSVHQAQVSWKRIKPLMKPVQEEKLLTEVMPDNVSVENLTVAMNGNTIIENVTFSADVGQIIGVTGPVACGKSTLGKAFLCEFAHEGHITFGGRELSEMTTEELFGTVGYLGHDPELVSDSVRNNVLLGKDEDPQPYLEMVELWDEVSHMPQGADTQIGTGGVLLSGGQQQRVALARTLAHPKPVMILDDPFSALDRSTEEKIFAELLRQSRSRIILLISHRLYLFPKMDKVIWMENGLAKESTHSSLMETNAAYRELYNLQQGGDCQ